MRAFLDACVLYPPLVRTLLTGAGAVDLLQPFWSPRVLAEWQISVARKQGAEQEAVIVDIQDRLAARFAQAAVSPDLDVEASLDLPDPADNHVLAAAIAADAKALITFNLRDFPARALSLHNIEPRHPDGFLWQLFSVEPDQMALVIQDALSDFEIAPATARSALKRARLPRLAKAWANARS